MHISSLRSVALCLSTLVAAVPACSSKDSGGGGTAADACKPARTTMASGWDALDAKVMARKTQVLAESRAQNDADTAARAASAAWSGAGDAMSAQQAAVKKVAEYATAAETTDASRKQLVELSKGEAAKGTGDPAVAAQVAEAAKAMEAATADLAALRASASKLDADAASAVKACVTH